MFQRPTQSTVLISSISKKVPLIQSVKRAVDQLGEEISIVGADKDVDCIGKHFVSQFWKMPPLNTLDAKKFLLGCQEYNIGFAIPTRDGELDFFSTHKQFFLQNSIHIMVSDKRAIDICQDKLRFYQTLSKLGYPVILTSEHLEDIDAPYYVVKERFGGGAKEIGIKLLEKEAKKHATLLKNPLFQPYLEGEEVSVDFYVDKQGKTKGVIARKRERVVGGESQITSSFKSEKLEKMCRHLAEGLKIYGAAMFQLIRSKDDGRYYFLESNPRFGGASTLSLAMGLDSFYWFLLESLGADLSAYPFKRSQKEKRLIRYPKDLIV